MSADRDVSDVVLSSFTARIRRGGEPSVVARDLVGIARAHGVRFAVPAHWHDPNADPFAHPEPGDQEAGLAAALAALGKGICAVCGARVELADGDDGQVIAPHEVSDDPPHPPFRKCPGAGKPPRAAQATDEQEHRD